MSQLFTPLKLGKLTLANRIVIAPMCQYSATTAGLATSWHTIHLGNLALSGAGLLIIEATAVEPDGRISPYDLGLWNEETQQALAKVVDAVQQNSLMPLGIQLAHAGRKASTNRPWLGGEVIASNQGGWIGWGPSSVAFEGAYQPQQLSLARIEEIKQQFVDAAKRAEQVGFKLIELHAAHGYLLHQFLSPLANQRQDNYGGSLENRLRLTLEVFSAIRQAVNPNIAVGIRISATDWIAGGWTLEESIILARQLEKMGCDYIHVSSGGLSMQQNIPAGPNYQVPLAEKITQQVTMPVIAVGLITEPEQAEAIVATGQAHAVGIGRGMLYDPRWPWHAAAKLKQQIPVAGQYLRSEPYAARGTLTLDNQQ